MAKKNPKIDDTFEHDKLYDFGVDVKSRTIKLIGDIDEDSFYILSCNLTTLENESNQPIKIILKTDGGCIDSGMAIIERIKSSICEIHIHAMGFIASMGILILASGDKRTCSSMTSFMHHESSYCISDRHKNNKSYVKVQENQDIKMCKWLAKQTKKDYKFWKDLGVHVDHYFEADQAFEYGLIDEVLDI